MSEPDTPDELRDVIVQHVTSTDAHGASSGGRWLIFLGRAKRAEMEDPNGALVFARLLADLSQGRVWVRHGGDDVRPLGAGSIRGCSCC